MANTSKTFRLFLSSTFNDMRAERDSLQENVFPKLRAYCDKHGFSFQAIDLRWGVSSEAGNDQKTMQICIDEVKRCKNALTPHFAIMLGERYGWIPLPDTVEATEFELVKNAVLNKFKDNNKVKEYIELWYKEDTNSIPAQYILQPKLTPEHQDWKYWGKVESTLRDAFKSVVGNELRDKLDDEQKSKYIKSATEQEILEGLFKNKEHKDKIYFYNRDFTNIDKISEKEFAALEQKDKKFKKKIEEYNKNNPTDKKAAYEITVKHFSDFKNMIEDKLDDEIRSFHTNLIEHIKSELPQQNVKEYKLKLNTSLERTQDSVTQEYLKQFCDDFYETIFSSMKKEIENFQEQDKQTRELNSQKEFMLEKSKIFVGREEFLTKINNYITSADSNAPLVIYADSGSGKSALMAKVISEIKKNHINESTNLIYRFVGTSELSNSPINLLKSLYAQLIIDKELKDICDEYISENELQVDTVLSDEKELSKMLANLIENYPEDKKLIFFIDALDQFIIKDKLDWLPRTISSNTKIIISTLPESYQGIDYLPRLKQKYKDESYYLFLKPFNSDEASSMIDEYLSSFKRRITTKQKEKLLNAFVQSGSPLYLKILLEEASQWASYTDIEGEDYNYPKGLDELIARLFKRLHTHSHHSLPLINYAFSYIACSKDGLAEPPELFDILSQEKDIMDDVSNEFYPRPQRLPAAVWARLYSEMGNYLSVKEVDGMDQISFFHRKFNEGAYRLNLNFIKDDKEKFITDESRHTRKEDSHKNLAEFYKKVYDKTLDVQTTQESALTELPFQLIMSKQKEKSLELLTNFEFLMKKFKLNRTAEVMEDYALAKAEGMSKQLEINLNEKFNIFDNFLTSNKYILEKGDDEWDSSKIFFQLSIEHADNSPLTIEAEEYENNKKIDWDYLKKVNRKENIKLNPIVKEITIVDENEINEYNISDPLNISLLEPEKVFIETYLDYDYIINLKTYEVEFDYSNDYINEPEPKDYPQEYEVIIEKLAREYEFEDFLFEDIKEYNYLIIIIEDEVISYNLLTNEHNSFLCFNIDSFVVIKNMFFYLDEDGEAYGFNYLEFNEPISLNEVNNTEFVFSNLIKTDDYIVTYIDNKLVAWDINSLKPRTWIEQGLLLTGVTHYKNNIVLASNNTSTSLYLIDCDINNFEKFDTSSLIMDTARVDEKRVVGVRVDGNISVWNFEDLTHEFFMSGDTIYNILADEERLITYGMENTFWVHDVNSFDFIKEKTFDKISEIYLIVKVGHKYILRSSYMDADTYTLYIATLGKSFRKIKEYEFPNMNFVEFINDSFILKQDDQFYKFDLHTFKLSKSSYEKKSSTKEIDSKNTNKISYKNIMWYSKYNPKLYINMNGLYVIDLVGVYKLKLIEAKK